MKGKINHRDTEEDSLAKEDPLFALRASVVESVFSFRPDRKRVKS
jgi:hypothetical protein